LDVERAIIRRWRTAIQRIAYALDELRDIDSTIGIRESFASRRWLESEHDVYTEEQVRDVDFARPGAIPHASVCSQREDCNPHKNQNREYDEVMATTVPI
jgi:hypothetical protein